MILWFFHGLQGQAPHPDFSCLFPGIIGYDNFGQSTVTNPRDTPPSREVRRNMMLHPTSFYERFEGNNHGKTQEPTTIWFCAFCFLLRCPTHMLRTLSQCFDELHNLFLELKNGLLTPRDMIHSKWSSVIKSIMKTNPNWKYKVAIYNPMRAMYWDQNEKTYFLNEIHQSENGANTVSSILKIWWLFQQNYEDYGRSD